MTGSFFALISRMRNIRRWGLMRNSIEENIQEHSHMTAVLAHALALIRRDVFGRDAEPEKAAAAALYHAASEIITGDMPPPVKFLPGGAVSRGRGNTGARQGGRQALGLYKMPRGAQGGEPRVYIGRKANQGGA